MRSSSPGSRAFVSRRTTLLALPAAASVTALAGCRWGPESNDDEVASGSTPPPVDADRQLVDRAVAAIATTGAIVGATVEQRPGLQEKLAGFATLHEAHLAHLGADAVATETETDGTEQPRRLAGVLRAERDLQDQLIGLSMSAGSGRLARSLASMAAGVAQHLAVTTGADA